MKKLLLLRHANAAPDNGTGDHERPLTEKGLSDATSVGKFISENSLNPDLILCSSARRTVETAQQILTAIVPEDTGSIPTLYDRKLYLPPTQVLFDEIQMAPKNIETLLVISHNPGVAELAVNLAENDAQKIHSYAEGTLSIFDINADDWYNITPQSIKFNNVFAP